MTKYIFQYIQDRVIREDGKTCGLQCYKCDGAATNEECNSQVEDKDLISQKFDLQLKLNSDVIS